MSFLIPQITTLNAFHSWEFEDKLCKIVSKLYIHCNIAFTQMHIVLNTARNCSHIFKEYMAKNEWYGSFQEKHNVYQSVWSICYQNWYQRINIFKMTCINQINLHGPVMLKIICVRYCMLYEEISWYPPTAKQEVDITIFTEGSMRYLPYTTAKLVCGQPCMEMLSYKTEELNRGQPCMHACCI